LSNDGSSGDDRVAKGGAPGKDFIRARIDEDLAAGRNGGRVSTRFPPEPNGYLHIGHAKSICLNFGIAGEYAGATCNLRFDDTNPNTEATEYVEGIQEDVHWLGFDWEDRLKFTSDYFGQLHAWAVQLIEQGLAFVDDQNADEIRANHGTLTEPGRESPCRGRSPEENLDLFHRMTNGEFEEGEKVLRAKIDMGSSVLPMRDPILYRIVNTPHHRTGDEFRVYPMYDFAHGLSDAIEGITHSLCTLEFQDHRPLYDWFLDHLDTPSRPEQIEFSRLGLTHTVMSKRLLRRLVEEGHVAGWDDPRLPTIRGLRRRGYTAAAIRGFCEGIGVTRSDSTIEMARLEHEIRQDLNAHAERRMAVLRPLKLVIENYPEAESEELEAINNPEDAGAGQRKVPFGRELWIERDDFMEDPPKKFFRLGPGREVRLRYAYFVTCTDVVKDEAGEVVEVRCTYDPATRGGDAPDGRKVKGTIHWVSAAHAVRAEVRLYDKLFTIDDPARPPEGRDFVDFLNPESLEVLDGAMLEPSLADWPLGKGCQFERTGYFCLDPDSAHGAPVFNRTVTLRDSWAKIAPRQP
jgi:glutaminyl-tRNA synthetase